MSGPHWTIPDDLLSRSVAVLKPHGEHGNEGLALWFGRASEASVTVTHVVDVSGPGFHTSPLYMSVSMLTMARLTALADQLGMYLVGQIHSHPGWLVELSSLDQAHGIRVAGFLSVVCPHYAQRPGVKWSDCGVHVFEDARYRRLARREVTRRLSPGPHHVIALHCEAPV
jgi:proteasome lid subunit RPN8/RPN11